jgi:hypothetical protein
MIFGRGALCCAEAGLRFTAETAKIIDAKAVEKNIPLA